MTYKQAVDSFRTEYRFLANEKLLDEEILYFISKSQQYIQHEHGIINKSSQDNTTAQTTCVVGTATYTAGTTVSTIPNDIHSIYRLTLDDTLVTELKPVGMARFRNTTKPTGRPFLYAIEGEGSNMVLELETKPDSAYVMTIRYIQEMELFTGSGTDTTWSDFDKSSATWGGSLKLVGWEDLIIRGAIAKVIDSLNIKGIVGSWEQDVRKYYNSKGQRNFSGDIIASPGVRQVARIPGQDEPRN